MWRNYLRYCCAKFMHLYINRSHILLWFKHNQILFDGQKVQIISCICYLNHKIYIQFVVHHSFYFGKGNVYCMTQPSWAPAAQHLYTLSKLYVNYKKNTGLLLFPVNVKGCDGSDQFGKTCFAFVANTSNALYLRFVLPWGFKPISRDILFIFFVVVQYRVLSHSRI